jgi:bHLH factor
MTGETAQSLQAVSQAGFFPIQNQHHQMPFPGPGIGDPGPSSHPRGPPNLGQLSAIAAAAGQTPPAPPHTQDGGEALSEDPGLLGALRWAPMSGPVSVRTIMCVSSRVLLSYSC